MASTSLDEVIALLNRDNLPAKELTRKNVSFSEPAVDVGELYNTRMTMSGVPVFGYYGDVEFFYTRLNLPELVPDTAMFAEAVMTKAETVAQLNRRYGLYLTEDDLEDFTPPTLNPGDTVSVPIQCRAGSLGFVGVVNLVYQYGKPELTAVISQRTMGLLKHPIATPLTGYASARMLTWGKDMTSLRDAFAIDKKTGSYTDFSAIQVAAQYLNIPGWLAGPLEDHPTSEVADANPAFDRVMIQRAVISSGMVGDIYFHYTTFDEV